MKKVSLVALLATLGIAGANANPAAPANCPKAFQGFHLGGNVGIGLGTGKQLVAVGHNDGDGFVADEGVRNRLGLRGFDGGLNTGYTHRWCNFGLGLEFVANWTDSKGSFTVGDFVDEHSITSSAHLRNSLQVRANFSYVIANLVAPKLILGWDASRFKTRTTVNGFDTFNNLGNPVAFTASKSKYLNAFLVGLGVDFLATKHFIIGMDATLSMFNKTKSARTFNNEGALPETVTQFTSYKPSPYGKISLVVNLSTKDFL